MKKTVEFSRVLELSKEDVASLNNNELNELVGGLTLKTNCGCVQDTETTPACLTVDPKIPCI